MTELDKHRIHIHENISDCSYAKSKEEDNCQYYWDSNRVEINHT